ncbi:MAG TPA: UPF0182 family protein [Acidobacteriaceae bacterium]|jgi:hypothetical protein|nr:UPF0182 family protein [Acidobacteriaceae bacterium]
MIELPGPRARSNRIVLILLIVVVAIFLGSNTALSYFVDSLWFSSLGFRDVFWKSTGLQWAVFAVAFLLTFLLLYGWFLALWRMHQAELPNDRAVFIGQQRMSLPLRRLLRILGVAVSLGIAFISALALMAEWPTFALFWYAPRAAAPRLDPVFARPVSFYLFVLPAWQLVAGWLMVLALIACIAAGGFLLLSGGTRAMAREHDRERESLILSLPWRGVSIAFAFFLAMLAVQVYLGRFGALFAPHTIFSGVQYTDAHITITGMLIVAFALLIGAAIAASNAFTAPRPGRLVAAVLPALACFVIVQLVGWYVSSFIVKPNQLDRERPYIAWNIAWTRQAWDLDRVTQEHFPAETTPDAADPDHNQVTLRNIRLWDWRALQSTLRQIQEIRTYYDFPDIDIDRYTINGDLREVMLAVRELSLDKLPDSSRNWINEKLIYTHGYGITMNSVNGFTPEGLPTLYLSNMPVESTVPGLSVTQPEIYYGQLTNSDVYVKTRQEEFNYPQGQANNLTSYQGSGGIVLGGMLRRTLIAADRGDLWKVPFSDDITPQSRLLMRRNILNRVRTLAPFLSWDADPYIVIGDNGRLYWMLDAYTTSDSYPDSASYPFGDDTINYMRNSVKVVVDAYNGTTTFYVFDPRDPIITAWRSIFPSLFRDASAMPTDLRRHIRYPQFLLEEQASVYGLYHMSDPEVFYNREDLWTVASELGLSDAGDQQTQMMEPNYVLMKLPGASSAEFIEILPFTPANRNNLIGWIAGRSDGVHYGTAIVYDFPKTKLVDGPMQIEARIDQNAELSGQLTLWNQQGSHARRGTLLVIPCGHALLYAEPIYLQAQQSPMPELRLVVLALQDRLAYGPTFQDALAALFEGQPSSLTSTGVQAQAPSSTQAGQSTTPGTPSSTSPGRAALVASAAQDLADYQSLTAQGKLAQAGQKLEDLKRKLSQLQAGGK